MKKDRKIMVILTPAFPAHESETTWVPPVQLFVKKLVAHYPHLSVVVLAFNYPHHTGHYTWHGANVISFDGMTAKKINRLWLWRKVWQKLKQLNRQRQIIGLFSFWCGECALVGTYFSKHYGIKHHCWISGMDALPANKLVKWIRPMADELVAMSPFLATEFYTNHGITPRHTIAPGIDPREYDHYPGKRDIDILGVGSLHALKQYDVFIRVVKEISRSIPSVKAVICGAGKEEANLQQLIDEWQLHNHVCLAGRKEHGEVLRYMQRAKVFLHTSSYEGFGMVYLEALYAGARIVSLTYPLDQPHPHWQVAHTVEDMATNVKAILADPGIRYSSSLVYTMSDSVKSIMKLFRQ